eukprot:8223926-Pyramimonas_sp.AAC.1
MPVEFRPQDLIELAPSGETLRTCFQTSYSPAPSCPPSPLSVAVLGQASSPGGILIVPSSGPVSGIPTFRLPS